MTGPARRCAVLGSPIAHSLSPVLHRAAYAEAGLDWTYDACEVREDELAGFLDGLDPGWRGLSLTMPLKRAVVLLVHEVSPAVEQSGVANTVLLEDGRRTADNTDIPGAVAAIAERTAGTDLPVARGVILGGGATATSVLLALDRLGCAEVTLVVREPSRARGAVAAADSLRHGPVVRVTDFDTPCGDPDIVVSTIPAAAQDERVLAIADRAAVVFDVLYDPWPTPLARRALGRGAVLVGGLDLLVHQAAAQFALMTGSTRSPLQAMRVAGERALAAG